MSTYKITIENTNNPAIIKFCSNGMLTEGGSYQFNNIDEAKESPLAQQFFHLPFISKVYITANFIALERYDIVEWAEVQEEIRELIEMYLNDNNVVVTSAAKTKKRPVEVYAESTPNPSVLMFGSNQLLSKQDFEYKSKDAVKNSPLATELFNFPFVKEVYIAENYVSITKTEAVEWNEIMHELRGFIKNYIQEGKTIIDESVEVQKEVIQSINIEDLSGTSADIASILDEYIKPAVAADGGNIIFQSYDEENKIVNVILQGACSGCPSSTITLKNGIETTLKEMLPNKVNEVVAING